MGQIATQAQSRHFHDPMWDLRTVATSGTTPAATFRAVVYSIRPNWRFHVAARPYGVYWCMDAAPWMGDEWQSGLFQRDQR